MFNKQHIVLIRDHSVSMRSLKGAAIKDYNKLINDIAISARDNNIETTLTVVECGNYDRTTGSLYSPFNTNPSSPSSYQGVVVPFKMRNINSVSNIIEYATTGGATPLLDSIGQAIDLMMEPSRTIPVLIMGITDGHENASSSWTTSRISSTIRSLTSTGMWTFAFRCPKTYGKYLNAHGIPLDNIQEWDTTNEGLRRSTEETSDAVRSYYAVRARGETSTDKFYVNTKDLRVADIKKAHMNDVSGDVSFVTVDETMAIKAFAEKQRGYYHIGAWHYELTKPETLQSSKRILIRNKNTRKVYSGNDARDLLGLPHNREVKIYPQGITSTNYEIYVQSLSVNRKLVPGTKLCIYRV
jgi:hypothetical protein